MVESLYSIKESGEDKKIKLFTDGYGLVIGIMKNGCVWTETRVDEELLSMIDDVIRDYWKIIGDEP